MSYGEVRRGPMFYAYPVDYKLGFVTEVRPFLLEKLQERLKDYPLNWTQVKFLDNNKEMIPDEPGVYFFCAMPQAANITAHHIILYIGKASNLRVRYGNYMQERKKPNDADRRAVVDMLNIYHDKLYFNYCRLGRYEIERVEDALLDAFYPPCNTKFSRAEIASVGKPKPAF